MSKLLIKNLTPQKNDFHFFDGTQWQVATVPAGAQIQVGEDDMPVSAMEKTIGHHKQYNIVDDYSLPLRPGFVGLTFSIVEDELSAA